MKLYARRCARFFLLAAVYCSSLAVPVLSRQVENPGSGKKLTLDRLYSLPWLIGTRPQSPVWSQDSQRLAFLWNDDGGNFYDVWLTTVQTGTPVRVTSMPRPTMPPAPGTDIGKLEQVAKAETDAGVSAVIWAPDGSHLLFNYHGQLYSVVPGDPPHRLVDSPEPVQEAAAAPTGSRAAYLSAGALWVLDTAGDHPAARKIYAPAEAKIEVEAFFWSHDGKDLAFIEADARRVPVRGIPDYLGEETLLKPVKRPFPGEPSEARRLGFVSAEGGVVRWASLGEDPLDLLFGVAWSPDDRTVLVDKSDLYIKDRRLLLVDPHTGTSKLLLREQDSRNVTAEWWSDWAPDGKGIYFLSDRDNDYHVYYQAVTGGAPTPVTRGEWAVFSVELPSRSKVLFVTTNQGKVEERQVFRVSMDNGKLRQITASAGTHTAVSSPDGRWLADIFSSDTTPSDLYLQPADKEAGPGNIERQVTHSPLPEFAEYRWVAARYVDFPNVHDGTMLHARLTLPPDFDKTKKYPAILGSVYSNTVHNQWGGRIFHPTWGLDQYFAQQGYVLLNVDISGSSGYGKHFRQRIGQNYGGVDVDDLYSGVKYLVAQGFVDEKRIGIWGSSYGGLLTSMSLFAHPGVYRAGVAGAPATSLFHAQTGEMRTMMAPQTHQEQYVKSSPFLRSSGLEDHLMILHGMRDDTVLFKDSVTLEQRLILQGKDVDLVVLPNAPHGWDTRDLAQTRFAYRKLVNFFGRYLGEGPTR